MSAVADVLRSLHEAVRSIGARWYLFGAQAALVHGSSRLTADVDATVSWDDAQNTGPLIAAFRAHGFAERPVGADFVARTRVLPMEHLATGIGVDVVLGGPGLEELFLSRSREHDIEGVRVPVASAEDLIAMKVLGGRAKDDEDVRALLAANAGKLDLAHVRTVLAELEAALDRRDLMPALDAAIADVRGT
jgi:uncharacterized nucleotidyltransferase DUF6036